MLTFVTFLWKQPEGYKTYFNATHVNTLYHMLHRNVDIPFRFICINDFPDSEGKDLFHKQVISFPLWQVDLPEFDIEGKNPNCYKRLKLFDAEAGGIKPIVTQRFIGQKDEWHDDRIVLLDLDLMIVGNITKIVTIPGEFVGWKKAVPYQGAFWMLKIGSRQKVWDLFIKNPLACRAAGKALRYVGSDQAWISTCLGKGNERVVGTQHGVYSFLRDKVWVEKTLPSDARIVIFHGSKSPWHPEILRNWPWVKEHYR